MDGSVFDPKIERNAELGVLGPGRSDLMKEDACRIGRNCQKRFWYGFRRVLVDLKSKGVDAWTERFDHIDNHFMGRNGNVKRGIENCMPIDIGHFSEQAGAQDTRRAEPTHLPLAHIELPHLSGSKR